MTLLNALKRLLFRLSTGFMPRCACGGRATRVRLIMAGGHVIGMMYSCGKHVVVLRNNTIMTVSSEDDEDDVYEAMGC